MTLSHQTSGARLIIPYVDRRGNYRREQGHGGCKGCAPTGRFTGTMASYICSPTCSVCHSLRRYVMYHETSRTLAEMGVVVRMPHN